MARAHWFKFYGGDYLLDSKRDSLPLEAQGILVLMWSVLSVEGELPADPIEIARKCRVDKELLQLHMQSLMQFFCKTVSGSLISLRLQKELARHKRISKVRSEAAKSKHLKRVAAIAHAKGDANAVEKRGEPEPEPDIIQVQDQVLYPAVAGVHANASAKRDAKESTNETPGKIGQLKPEEPTLFKQIEHGLKSFWTARNPEAPSCPYAGPAEGQQIKLLIKKTPGWTLDHYERCWRHMFDSDGFNPSTTPLEIIPRLPKYLNGPLNQFHQTESTNGKYVPTKADRRVSQMVETTRRVCDEARRTINHNPVGLPGADAGAVGEIVGREPQRLQPAGDRGGVVRPNGASAKV